MNLIVAVNKYNFIGNNGKMLWHSKEDFKHFKQKTMGGILIVGKTTYEVDLNKKELPGRELVVIGSNYNTLFEGVKKAIEAKKEIWVIGGLTIYNQLMPLIENIHISYVNNDLVGDKQFFIPSNYRGKIYKYYFDN